MKSRNPKFFLYWCLPSCFSGEEVTWFYGLSIWLVNASHLLLQAIHYGSHVSLPVLLDLLHLHLELLFGHAAEVAVLLHGLHQHVALVFALLSQGLQDLCLLGLKGKISEEKQNKLVN